MPQKQRNIRVAVVAETKVDKAALSRTVKEISDGLEKRLGGAISRSVSKSFGGDSRSLFAFEKRIEKVFKNSLNNAFGSSNSGLSSFEKKLNRTFSKAMTGAIDSSAKRLESSFSRAIRNAMKELRVPASAMTGLRGGGRGSAGPVGAIKREANEALAAIEALEKKIKYLNARNLHVDRRVQRGPSKDRNATLGETYIGASLSGRFASERFDPRVKALMEQIAALEKSFSRLNKQLAQEPIRGRALGELGESNRLGSSRYPVSQGLRARNIRIGGQAGTGQTTAETERIQRNAAYEMDLNERIYREKLRYQDGYKRLQIQGLKDLSNSELTTLGKNSRVKFQALTELQRRTQTIQRSIRVQENIGKAGTYGVANKRQLMGVAGLLGAKATDSEIKSYLAATQRAEAAQAKFGKTSKSGLGATSRGWHDLQSAIKGTHISMGLLERTTVRFFQIFLLHQAVNSFERLVGLVTEFQVTVEQLQLGFAETLSVSSRLYDSLGKQLPLVDQIKISFIEAKQALEGTIDASIKYGLPAQQVAEAFAVTAGAARAGGIELEQSIGIITQLVILAERIQIPFNVLARDVRDIFTGLNVQRTILGNLLGLHQAQVQEWIKENELGDKLVEKLQIVELTALENIKTLRGLRLSILAIFQDLGTKIGAGVFLKIKDVLSEIRENLNKIRLDPEKVDELRKSFEGLAAAMANVVFNLVTLLPLLKNLLITIAGAKVGAAIAGFGAGAYNIGAAAYAITTRGQQKLAAAKAAGGIGGSLSQFARSGAPAVAAARVTAGRAAGGILGGVGGFLILPAAIEATANLLSKHWQSSTLNGAGEIGKAIYDGFRESAKKDRIEAANKAGLEPAFAQIDGTLGLSGRIMEVVSANSIPILANVLSNTMQQIINSTDTTALDKNLAVFKNLFGKRINSIMVDMGDGTSVAFMSFMHELRSRVVRDIDKSRSALSLSLGQTPESRAARDADVISRSEAIVQGMKVAMAEAIKNNTLPYLNLSPDLAPDTPMSRFETLMTPAAPAYNLYTTPELGAGLIDTHSTFFEKTADDQDAGLVSGFAAKKVAGDRIKFGNILDLAYTSATASSELETEMERAREDLLSLQENVIEELANLAEFGPESISKIMKYTEKQAELIHTKTDNDVKKATDEIIKLAAKVPKTERDEALSLMEDIKRALREIESTKATILELTKEQSIYERKIADIDRGGLGIEYAKASGEAGIAGRRKGTNAAVTRAEGLGGPLTNQLGARLAVSAFDIESIRNTIAADTSRRELVNERLGEAIKRAAYLDSSLQSSLVNNEADNIRAQLSATKDTITEYQTEQKSLSQSISNSESEILSKLADQSNLRKEALEDTYNTNLELKAMSRNLDVILDKYNKEQIGIEISKIPTQISLANASDRGASPGTIARLNEKLYGFDTEGRVLQALGNRESIDAKRGQIELLERDRLSPGRSEASKIEIAEQQFDLYRDIRSIEKENLGLVKDQATAHAELVNQLYRAEHVLINIGNIYRDSIGSSIKGVLLEGKSVLDAVGDGFRQGLDNFLTQAIDQTLEKKFDFDKEIEVNFLDWLPGIASKGGKMSGDKFGKGLKDSTVTKEDGFASVMLGQKGSDFLGDFVGGFAGGLTNPIGTIAKIAGIGGQESETPAIDPLEQGPEGSIVTLSGRSIADIATIMEDSVNYIKSALVNLRPVGTDGVSRDAAETSNTADLFSSSVRNKSAPGSSGSSTTGKIKGYLDAAKQLDSTLGGKGQNYINSYFSGGSTATSGTGIGSTTSVPYSSVEGGGLMSSGAPAAGLGGAAGAGTGGASGAGGGGLGGLSGLGGGAGVGTGGAGGAGGAGAGAGGGAAAAGGVLAIALIVAQAIEGGFDKVNEVQKAGEKPNFKKGKLGYTSERQREAFMAGALDSLGGIGGIIKDVAKVTQLGKVQYYTDPLYRIIAEFAFPKETVKNLVTGATKQILHTAGLPFKGVSKGDVPNDPLLKRFGEGAGAAFRSFIPKIIGTGQYKNEYVGNAIVRASQYAGFGTEDTIENIKAFTQALVGEGSLSEAVMKVRAETNLSKTDMTTQRDTLQQVIVAYGELPNLADYAALTTELFSEKGVISLKRFERVLEDVKESLSGVGETAVEFLDTGDIIDVGVSLADRFTETIQKRVQDRLLEEAFFAQITSRIGIEINKLSEDIIAGDVTGATSRFAQISSMIERIQSELATKLGPFVSLFEIFRSGQGSEGLVNQGQVSPVPLFDTPSFSRNPGPRGSHSMVMTQGQETMRSGEQEDRVASGVDKLVELSQSRPNTNITLVLEIDGKDVPVKVKSVAGSSRNGVKVASPNLGVV